MEWIECKAPTRVDLCGGTLDISPLHRLIINPVTLNIAVGLYAKVKGRSLDSNVFSLKSVDQGLVVKGSYNDVIKTKELPIVGLVLEHLWKEAWPALEIEVSAESPKGAGLGGSSSIAVAVVWLIIKLRDQLDLEPMTTDDHSIVQIAQDIETQLIRVPTGCQDYWGALKGGANIIRFPPGNSLVTNIFNDDIFQISRKMLLCYSGKSRASADNNWKIFRKFFDGDEEVCRGLQEIADYSNQVAHAFLKGEWSEVIEGSKREWNARLCLWPGIETNETQLIDRAAIKAGAAFTRICGAGGGGVMAIFANEGSHEKVIRAVQSVGGSVLKANLGVEGLSVDRE